jgi:AraC-like DNA-binding protein
LTKHPADFADRLPCAWGLGVDVLSDVLRAVRLTGAVYFDIRARAPWVAETPPMAEIQDRVMPGFERVIFFHVLLDGGCRAELPNCPGSAVAMEAGDAVIIVGGEPHLLASHAGLRTPPDMSVYEASRRRQLPYVLNEYGGDGAPAHVVCGFLGCDVLPFNPILDALPPMLHVGATSLGGSLIHDLIRVALGESRQPSAGGEAILAKLSELLFLQALRQHLHALPPEATGWLSGLRDRHVGRALGLMHARPGARWTLDGLAQEVGLSRSTFAERFAALVGTPPMQYLASWRLQVAAQCIERQGMSIARAAAEVGYESEAAFNRAFKKQVGAPPGSWRRARLSAARA